jgi:biopolymer transport protein ExbD
MAEIDSSGGGGKGGKVRSKKMSTKIDMTPMVDLGFLLITFFMLTTTLQKPQVMTLNMPDKDDKTDTKTMPVKVSETITLIPWENGRLYWFQGLPTDPKTVVEKTDLSAKGLRQVLLQKKNDPEIGEKFTIVMKPYKKSNYKTVVDALDEFAITGCERYAIVGIHPTDEALIRKYETENNIK